jgi:hypothetical protein
VAGLLAGYGVSTASSAQLATFDLATLSLVIYALDADAPIVAGDTVAGGPDGGGEAPCEFLVGSDGLGATTPGSPFPYKGVLTEGTDYWQVGTLAPGQIASGTTWLGALKGCVPGEAADAAARCGAGYGSATGNLAMTFWKLDSTTRPDGGVGAQLAHASPAWDAVTATFGGSTTAAGFYTSAGATPTLTAIESTAKSGSLLPATLATVPGVTFDGGSGFFAEALSSAGSPILDCASPMLLGLPEIAALTSGNTSTGPFATGAGYAFVLVGDPTAPPGPYVDTTSGEACAPGSSPTCSFNGRFVHFLAFPTQ